MPATASQNTLPVAGRCASGESRGQLIINADDWGRDYETTERIHECWRVGAISSSSAMVFMQDSERAAEIAHDRGLDAGLHLNFTTPFSGLHVTSRLHAHQGALSRHLTRSRFAQTMFHPALARSFEYVARAQYDEYSRLYGAEPKRIDGHHHMHLCANVLVQGLLPSGAVIRRNFSFQPDEKHVINRCYRQIIDTWLARYHPLTDYFFSLAPLRAERLARFVALAASAIVEIETHPVNALEYEMLRAGTSTIGFKVTRVAPRYAARWMSR